MTNEEMMRPYTLPAYWEVQELLDAFKVTGINCEAYSDKIEIETIWEGKSCKVGDPVLSFDNVPEVKELIDSDVLDEFLELDPEDQEKIRVKYFRETVGIIADALNAPVLATEEVLAGLPKDASFWLCWGNQKIKARYDYDRCDEDSYKWIFESTHHDRHYMADSVYEFDGSFTVEADKDDPKTADYLRQFTLDGKRKETKDV